MILAMAVGAGLALAGKLPAALPQEVSIGTQAMLGVLMGSYLEQSRKIFMQMQEQLNHQAESLFPGGAGARNTPTKR